MNNLRKEALVGMGSNFTNSEQVSIALGCRGWLGVLCLVSAGCVILTLGLTMRMAEQFLNSLPKPHLLSFRGWVSRNWTDFSNFITAVTRNSLYSILLEIILGADPVAEWLSSRTPLQAAQCFIGSNPGRGHGTAHQTTLRQRPACHN